MSLLKSSFALFIVMTILVGGVYPLLITVIAQVFMPFYSNGSLVQSDSRIVGSALIAQKFDGDHYFSPRPSFIDYNPISSGGSNLGPTSKKLREIVMEREKKLYALYGKGLSIPSEMLYASGSGLDPHISVDAAYFQVERVARARGATREQIQELLDSLAQGKQWFFLGPKYINVLELNLALDNHFPGKK